MAQISSTIPTLIVAVLPEGNVEDLAFGLDVVTGGFGTIVEGKIVSGAVGAQGIVRASALVDGVPYDASVLAEVVEGGPARLELTLVPCGTVPPPVEEEDVKSVEATEPEPTVTSSEPIEAVVEIAPVVEPEPVVEAPVVEEATPEPATEPEPAVEEPVAAPVVPAKKTTGRKVVPIEDDED